MKIALVCTNLGYGWRGLERFTLELFDTVQDELPITLFGSCLNGRANAVSLPCLKYDKLLRVFKGRARDNYYFNQLSYACSFIPYVALGNYDLIHYSEPAMGNFLFHAKRTLRLKYKTLFTNWGFTGDLCLRPDHVQEITLPAYEKTIASGISPKRITFLPYGLKAEGFRISVEQDILREQYNIPKDKIVILSVAALNRRHKRIDYLIREVSKLGGDYFLFVVGDAEEPDLIQLGRDLLGDRFRSLYVSFQKMPEIYRLANLFVIPSLIEGFCLALVEAMCAGLPVIAHEGSNFPWVLGDPRCLTDLSLEGNLSKKIAEIMSRYDLFVKLAEANRIRATERFDWNVLKKDYLKLYERTFSSAS